MQKKVSKEEWVAMFQEIGLSEEQMMAWHRLFEMRHPGGHEGFLEWLGLTEEEISGIRGRCR
ncbi:hypothetical protein [Desulfoluna sp.]|uniref:hypothetical protein n=1 Tax=Desulfoluna sp. TaxID=2045199 RepID=UPI00260F2714|nr:hypothetical protein [Desulfoluna sp.]